MSIQRATENMSAAIVSERDEEYNNTDELTFEEACAIDYTLKEDDAPFTSDQLDIIFDALAAQYLRTMRESRRTTDGVEKARLEQLAKNIDQVIIMVERM